MYTRKDYMDGVCTHEEYYAQFVTSSVKQLVRDRIGVEAILQSTDSNFRNVGLKEWDALKDITKTLINKKAWREAECIGMPANLIFWSHAANICILKEAARQIKEESVVQLNS